MSISGIGAAGYPVTGYQTRKTERSTESSAVGFMEAVAEKAAQDKVTDYNEKAFDMVGLNAPQDVKDAWMEAAKEVNANGVGIRGNGMMSHISQMMVQRHNKMLKGETENFDILGNTVKSAIKATEQALYNLDYPLAPAYITNKPQPWQNEPGHVRRYGKHEADRGGGQEVAVHPVWQAV